MTDKEENKRCYFCKNANCKYWCDLTGANIVLDLTVKDTMNCEYYVEKKNSVFEACIF